MTTVFLVINVIIFYIPGSSGEKLRKCLFCFKQQTEHSGFTGSTVTTEARWLAPAPSPCSRLAVSLLVYFYFPFRSHLQHLLLRATTTLLLYLLLTDVRRG